jgi:hypothetical protein
MSDERVTGGTGTIDISSLRQRGDLAGEADRTRLVSGCAWEEFCDLLKATGQHIVEEGAPDTALDRAEGFRYLATLAAAGIRHTFDLADPDRPRFLRNPDSAAGWGAENADNLYLIAHIRPDRTYRISGRRGTVGAFLIETKEGYMQLGAMRNFATLDSDRLQVEPDGTFDIVLSARPHPGNWIPLHPEATQVLIRQFFFDWESEEPAEFRIAAVDDAGERPAVLEPVHVARLLHDAALWIDTTVRVWNDWVRDLRSRHQPGVLAPACRYVGGADDILYGNDLYRLGEDEALIIESAPPDARYWAFQLVNLWFQAMDYANRQTSMNCRQARVDKDGRFRLVVAHGDPGVPNWLDTAGHREGVLQYRYVWAKTAPQPTVRVVPFGRLRKELPADTPAVTADERRRAIAARQRHMALRERG